MGKHGTPPTWTSTRGKTNKSTFRSSFGTTAQEIWGTAGGGGGGGGGSSGGAPGAKRFRRGLPSSGDGGGGGGGDGVDPPPPTSATTMVTLLDEEGEQGLTNAEQDNNEVKNLVREGEAEYLAGNLAKAEHLLTEALRRCPTERDAYSTLSRVYQELGLPFRAYAQQKKLIKMLSHFQYQYKLIPSYQHRRCAVLAEACELWDEAVDWYSTAILMEPGDRDSCVSRALIFLRTGREQMALDTCEDMLKLFPDDVHVLVTLAHAHRMLGNFDEAIKLYMRVARPVLSPAGVVKKTNQMKTERNNTIARAKKRRRNEGGASSSSDSDVEEEDLPSTSSPSSSSSEDEEERPKKRGGRNKKGALPPTPSSAATPHKTPVRGDEDEFIATALSTLSSLVDYLISENRFEEGSALVLRCVKFLRDGVSDDPSLSWSWELTSTTAITPAAAAAAAPTDLQPRRRGPNMAIPLDLAVQGCVCELRRDEDTTELAYIRTVAGCVQRLPDPLTREQVELAWALVQALFSVQAGPNAREFHDLGLGVALRFVFLDRDTALGPDVFCGVAFLENLLDRAKTLAPPAAPRLEALLCQERKRATESATAAQSWVRCTGVEVVDEL